MRKRITKLAIVAAVVISLVAVSVAEAHRLHYREAHKLALKLVRKDKRDNDATRQRLFGAERTNDHQIVWVYNADYADGTLCDAELVVRFVSKNKFKARAFFRDVHCEH